MASLAALVAEIQELLSGAGSVETRKMFGEFCIYLDGKPIALLCDNRLYFKPTEAGRAHLPDALPEPPFPGAKPYLCLPPDRWLDRERLCQAARATCDALPAPKPKKKAAAAADAITFAPAPSQPAVQESDGAKPAARKRTQAASATPSRRKAPRS